MSCHLAGFILAPQAAGYDCVEDASDADVLIYNTCSIRDKAEQKVYSALGRQVRIHCCTAQSAGCRRPENAFEAPQTTSGAARMSKRNASGWTHPHARHVQAKRKRMHMGDLKIVVAGCVAQQEGATLLRRVPEVDLVMGPQYANRCGRRIHY